MYHKNKCESSKNISHLAQSGDFSFQLDKMVLRGSFGQRDHREGDGHKIHKSYEEHTQKISVAEKELQLCWESGAELVIFFQPTFYNS